LACAPHSRAIELTVENDELSLGRKISDQKTSASIRIVLQPLIGVVSFGLGLGLFSIIIAYPATKPYIEPLYFQVGFVAGLLLATGFFLVTRH